MNDSLKRRPGPKPKTARNVAVWLAHQWHEDVEGCSAGAACDAVRSLWIERRYVGLGSRYSVESKAIHALLRMARPHLGEGQTIAWPGIKAHGKLFGAGAIFIPSSTPAGWVGQRLEIDGPYWFWTYGAERAEYLGTPLREGAPPASKSSPPKTPDAEIHLAPIATSKSASGIDASL